MSRDLKKVRGKALKIPRITVLLTGRWKSKCKGPELGKCLLACARSERSRVWVKQRGREIIVPLSKLI